MDPKNGCGILDMRQRAFIDLRIIHYSREMSTCILLYVLEVPSPPSTLSIKKVSEHAVHCRQPKTLLYYLSLIWCVFTVPATCWGFMGPVFIRKGSPPSNGRIGSPTSPLWVCAGLLLLFSWMISSKWAASPLAETPFWWPVGCTPFTTGPDTLCDGLRTAAPGLCRFPAAERSSINAIIIFF